MASVPDPNSPRWRPSSTAISPFDETASSFPSMPRSRDSRLPGLVVKTRAGSAVPRSRVDDRGAVRGKAGTQDGAAAERELRVRGRGWRGAEVPAESAPERGGGEERPRQDRGRPEPRSVSGLSGGGRRFAGRAGHRLQAQGHVPRRVEAVLGPLLETAAHDPVESRRRSRPSIAGSSPGLFAQDGGLDLGRLVSRAKARFPVSISYSRQAQREDVARRPHRPPAHLLRRHVAHRPQHHPRIGLLQPRAAPPCPCLLPPAAGTSFASPKSRILTRPSEVMKMFSGLRSRWMIPWRGRRQASATGGYLDGLAPGEPALSRSRRVWPSSSP